ncbi:MAG TPA: translation initiation factor IF-3 [Candidatus Colwellbacteria bacterium]|nr:translation initiation factor IF-3 [Candidatus Colwellbacteria bacterium]
MNNQISAPELRVVDETGKNLGVFPLAKALETAKAEGMDLIETVPGANPPVAKIMSFDKFRYQRAKELKKQRQSESLTKGLKQIRIGAKTAKNDLLTKIKKIEEFLDDGYKVEIFLRLRGREKANPDWAKKNLEGMLSLITAEHKITSPIKYSGNAFTVQISK